MWWRYVDDIFLVWQHGEEKLKEFLDIFNHYYPGFKFTSKYSRERIDFLDVEIIKEGNQFLTDVFVKSTDTHQYLHATSYHVYHSKKSIPYSQTLRFNRICSDNQLFDKRCNEPWLQWEVGETTNLEARKYRRTELLHSQREEFHKNKLVFNITYYPIFSKRKNILSKIHAEVPPRRRVSVVLAINQGVKFANMLPKHTNLNHHLRGAYIPLDYKIWIVLLRM